MPDSDVMAADWRRVAAAIEARIADLQLTKAEVIRRSGISQKSLDGYLAGEPIVRADKARGLCDALRWTRGSIDSILMGGEPTELAEPDPELVARISSLESRADQTEKAVDRLLRAAGIDP